MTQWILMLCSIVKQKEPFIITLHGVSYPEYDPTGMFISMQSKEIPSEANGFAGQNVERYSNPRWINM